MCCPPTLHAQQEATVFNFAFNLYQDGMYDLALNELNKFIREFPHSVQMPDALFYKGVALQKLGQYQDAIYNFETLISRYPNSLFGDDALYSLGETYLQEGKNRRGHKCSQSSDVSIS